MYYNTSSPSHLPCVVDRERNVLTKKQRKKESCKERRGDETRKKIEKWCIRDGEEELKKAQW